MIDASNLHRTPFRNFHQQYGAQLVDFAGWEMPLHYGSIIDEHKLVRSGAGLFDVSHMGRVTFTGVDARRFLERVLTRRISTMQPGQCRYALVCNESGGVLDDVIVYRFEDYWMLVVNASNRQKLLAHFEQVKAAEGFDKVSIDDVTFKTAMLACQGPAVMDIIGHFTSEVPALKNYHFCQKNLMVVKFTISRTGYTGEDGVEVIMGAMMAPMAIKLLMSEGGSQAAKIKPAGLGARDTLRLEAGMPLYGHELDEQTNPLEAGLNFAVNLDKGGESSGPQIPRFIGQDALERVAARGIGKKLVGLQLDGKRTPRQGAAVSRDGNSLGVVTSGCLSPTLGYPIAMAYVAPEAANIGDAVQVAVGSKTLEAKIVKLPSYRRAK